MWEGRTKPLDAEECVAVTSWCGQCWTATVIIIIINIPSGPQGKHNIPSGLQGKHKQAMHAKNREWFSGSSSSSGGEEWKSQEQEEIKRLRAQVELASKQQGAGKSLRSRANRQGEEVVWKKFEEETEYKKKLDEQKKSLQRQLREIEKFANMDPAFRNKQKEVWKEELEEIERKRTEFLLEHQKMQKKSQKLQSLRGKQRNYFMTPRDCEEEMQTLNKEWEEQNALHGTRCRALSERSGVSRKAAAELENEIQNLQVSEERRGSSASQSNGCCSPCIAAARLYSRRSQLSFWWSTSTRANCSAGAKRREGREAWEGEWDEDERMANGRYENTAHGSAVDPAEGSDDVGGSLKGGIFSTPRNGT